MRARVRKMLIEVLARFTDELASHKIRYSLIGGLAASIRGRVRATEDVDLILLCSLDQALELVKKLGKRGFSPLLDDYEQVARTALLIPLVDQSSRVQLDLAIGLSGFERDIVERADPMMIDDHEIFVATVEDLIVLKALAGRPQDIQDIAGMVEIQAERIDWEHCVACAARLQSTVDVDLVEQIERLRSR